MRFLRNNAIGVLALFVALGGTGYAASGGFTAASSGIKACAASNGVLKLQTGKKCKKGQTALSWNQQGVPGAKGATGGTGAAGTAGTPGAAGADGPKGNPGSAVAYLHVNEGGAIDTANSSGVVDVRHSPLSTEGLFCIYGNFAAHGATASIAFNEAAAPYMLQVGASGTAAFYAKFCVASDTGAPVKAIVSIQNAGAIAKNAGFYVTFD